MKNKLESSVYTAIFMFMCFKESVLASPKLIFILGVLAACSTIYFFKNF